MKKTTIIIFSLLIIIAVLSGCRKSKDDINEAIDIEKTDIDNISATPAVQKDEVQDEKPAEETSDEAETPGAADKIYLPFPLQGCKKGWGVRE